MPDLSLVVPAFNEARLLPRLLDSVERARAAAPEIAVEVIVADNASTDATAATAQARGCRVARVERRVIAAARNGGAAAASGAILAFTDADGVLHPGTFAAIAAAARDRRFAGGATGVTMERWSPGIALTYALMLPMVWLTGMDTGVVFCRREDVDFLWKLRRRGRRDGRRLVQLRGVKSVASTRKFDEFGDWHYFTAMPGLALRMLFRRSAANEFARRYWYRPRR
jgi:glycosyltransferase involved in cell wall biosynthesis